MPHPVQPLSVALLVTAIMGCSGIGAAWGRASDSSALPHRSGSVRSTTTVLVTSAATTTAVATKTEPRPTVVNRMPRPNRVVVVVMENRSYADIVGNRQAPYINALAARGALLTRSYALTHPSEPNYLALFSGSTQGVTNDSCPHAFSAANLGLALLRGHRSFAGYSEGLPSTGSRTCGRGAYARKHNPWVDFPSVPASANRPFASFPRVFAALPHLSFVIPNLTDDMHDGTVRTGDRWLQNHLGGYATWARSHNSLLVLTWDEDNYHQGNHIATVIAGAHVRPGRYNERVNHYRVLRTLTELERVRPVGHSAAAHPVTSIWRP